MKKHIIRTIASISACISTTLMLTSPSSAYILIGNYHLIGDLSNSYCYYVDSEYAAAYGVDTMRGAIAWEACPYVEIGWTRSTAPSFKTVEMLTTYTPPDDEGNIILASTAFYYHYSQYDIDQVKPYEQNWDFCTITVNEYGDPDHTTFAHEFGHVYGLNHNSDPTSIMCQLGEGRTATAPSADDFAGINAIYN